MSVPRCPDCQTKMVVGFVPDAVMEGGPVPESWYPGKPKFGTILGIVSTGRVRIDAKKLMPITAYRCPDCGLLRIYANPAED